jgi:molybdopterin-containing oxidoreductase family iron-sulfur binding subunit
LAEFPEARWHQYEPASGDAARQGAVLAFGEDVQTLYRFEEARVVLSIDADFLDSGPGHVRYAREFMERRRAGLEDGDMNRLYVVETMPSPTGSVADHRLALRAGQMEGFARAVARELGIDVESADESLADQAGWITAVASDLQNSAGECLVVAGEQQPPIVHALAHAMNETLGNVGSTVVYTDPIMPAGPEDQTGTLQELVEDMQAGNVQLLVILGVNPVYSAPADLNFAEVMLNVPTRVYWSQYEDETSLLCHWHIPATHYLESWSDVRTFDGAVSIVQPLILPLYEGCRSAHELLAMMLGQIDVTAYDIVRNYWADQELGGNFDQVWQTALHEGLIPETALPPRPGRFRCRQILPGRRPRRPRLRESLRLSSGPIPLSGTAASPITAGCRSYPNL